MEFIYKNAKINYTKSGTGPIIVLLHGFLESSSMWKFLIQAFENTHTLIAIDLPGHGKSDCLGYIHTMETFAQVVENILHHEKIAEATFIGHSMGGYVCLSLIEKNPAICSRLLLLNSTTIKDSEERVENRNRAIRLLKTHREAYIKMAITNLFAEASRDKFEVEIDALKENALSFPVQGIIAALEGMKIRKDRTQVLKNLTSPKFIIAGKEDTIMPWEEVKIIADGTNTFFYGLDGGHMSTIENRGALTEIIIKIISTKPTY